MEWSFNFVFVLMISWESQKFGLKNFLSWLNFDSIICLSGSILTQFSTRLARSSNLKITRLDPTRQSMTRLARGSNNFRLDPSLDEGQTKNGLVGMDGRSYHLHQNQAKKDWGELFYSFNSSCWEPNRVCGLFHLQKNLF